MLLAIKPLFRRICQTHHSSEQSDRERERERERER